MPAAIRPLATALTSARNSAAVTSTQPSPARRLNTTASAASRRVGDDVVGEVAGRGDARSSGAWRTRARASSWGTGGTAAGYRPTGDRAVSGTLAGRGPTVLQRSGASMAEQTTSSIVIDAAPAGGHGRHRRLRGLPRVGQGREEGRRSRRRAPTAGPSRSSSRSTSRRSRTSTPSPTTGTATARSPGPSSRARCCSALDGAYALRDRGDGSTEVTYRLALDVSHPADRHAQAQGREDPHRHRAQGPEEARRVARLSRGLRTVRILLFTGKGGVGKSTRRRRHGGARGRRRARARWCSPPTPRTRWPTPSARRSAPEPTEVGRRACSCSRSTPSCASSSRGPTSRATCCRVLDVAGVDPVAAEELTVIPGAEEVLALLELRLHALSGEWDVIVVDCAPDRRDAAAAGAARGARLVHDSGSSRSSGGWSRRCGRC